MGEDPKKPVDSTAHKTAFALAPGETKKALDLSGQGAIMSLRLGMTPWSPDTFFHTRLRITWDGQPAPAVDMPIASFFGAGGDTIGAEDVSGKKLTTLLFGFDGATGRCYSYWPMPYWSRARIGIVNNGRTAISRMEVEAVSASPPKIDYRPGESGCFCAKRTVDITPEDAPTRRVSGSRPRQSRRSDDVLHRL